MAQHAITTWVGTADDDVRLTAMEQSKRDGGVGGMEQRSLSLYDIPMQGRSVRAQDLRGSCFKVGHDGVHGYPAATDQNAGLSGRAEVDLKSALPQCARDAQGTVFFPDRAIRADGE